MINVSDLRNGIVFEENGNLFQVLSYEHIKVARGSGNVKVKARNLRSGAITEKSFITGARVQDVFTEKKKCSYLYADGNNVVFMDSATYEQFEIPKAVVGEQVKFLLEGMEVQVLVHNSEPLAVELPNSAEFIVESAGAGIKGNSVSNVWKKATLSNGLQVDVPLFIKDGDKVKVDTRSGQYMERVK